MPIIVLWNCGPGIIISHIIRKIKFKLEYLMKLTRENLSSSITEGGTKRTLQTREEPDNCFGLNLGLKNIMESSE